MKVEIIDLPKALTVETAKQFVGRIASVCTGVECKSDEHAQRVGEKNLTEAYGETPTRAWEFIPIIGNPYTTYNNFREVLKSGDTLENVVTWYNNFTTSEYNNFHIFHITAPRYVMAHLKTHTTLSSMMSSVRIGCNGEKEYEFPNIEKGQMQYSKERDCLAFTNDGDYLYKNLTGLQFTELLNKHYKRKEITKRPLSDFEVVEMKICGYSEAWEWFINQRTEKGVQKETREIAQMIEKLLGGIK